MKQYTLMNKNVELMDITLEVGSIEKIGNLRKENQHLLPVYFLPKGSQGISKSDFKEWWDGRKIPISRTGIKQARWHLHNTTLDYLVELSLGLSLSDHYWFRPDESFKWEDVNFFTNDFSENMGKLLITGEWNGGSLVSPDNTSDGVVRKRWTIVNEKRYLLKGSLNPLLPTEPFREVFASKLAKIFFGEKSSMVVPYHLVKDKVKHDDVFLSACPNFVTTDTEYVSFNQINAAFKRRNEVSKYQFCKQHLGKDSWVLDAILIMDYIVMNEDRHYGNFGMIRDTNTGEFLGSAPMFDTGFSLFGQSSNINHLWAESKPFRETHQEQIKLVNIKPFSENIERVRSTYQEVFWESFAQSPEGKERLSDLVDAVGKQIDSLLESYVQNMKLF